MCAAAAPNKPLSLTIHAAKSWPFWFWRGKIQGCHFRNPQAETVQVMTDGTPLSTKYELLSEYCDFLKDHGKSFPPFSSFPHNTDVLFVCLPTSTDC
jgi:hypothetical protein